MDVCSAWRRYRQPSCRGAEFRRLGERVLSITGGIADVTLDNGRKLLTLSRALRKRPLR